MSNHFVHLNLHTEFSIIDGMVRIEPLMDALATSAMNAVAVTDFCNLFAVVKVFQAAMAQGIKPIIGCELPCHDPEKPDDVSTLIVLCQNNAGYRNLTRLVSKAYIEGQYQGKPRVQLAWVTSHTEGLIALSGGCHGLIGKALLRDDEKLAYAIAKEYAELFPNRFYLEIQRTGRAGETIYNERVVRLAETLHLPLVATNAVRFLDSNDFDAHEARVCIHEGYTLADPRRNLQYSAEQYLRSPDEMTQLFHDLPEALANTVAISTRCTVTLNLGHNYLPSFPVPAGTTSEDYLANLAMLGFEKRLTQIFRNQSLEILTQSRAPYDDRLQLELKVINNMGFAGYFLIVADFIQWAKDNGVPVGPGRGSGAGSLVAYALGITDLDPLQYELLFERFLNPERVSMPDFDIDFCMEGRDRVIGYVADKYGRQSVSQIITFGTMAAKAVIRDVGRVLGHPYGFVDKLAKLIPFELGMTLTKAFTQEAELKRRYNAEEEVKELFELAMKLEGLTRNAGKHAGGVVIAPSQLTDFTALYCEQGGSQVLSQLDKDDVEAAGLVKFDFLGLRTLTIIDWTLRIINQPKKENQEELVDITLIPTDDAKTFALLKACKTTAVFQLESRGMKELIQRLQPDSFEDVIALVALFRPGPLQSGMVDDFIHRKHGEAAVEYPHPDVEPILKPTYGVILYQEQVMQIAQILANYTLGAADLLRRAMGKKKPEEMAQQRQIFVSGATARGVEEEAATHIFDLMEKFAGYGFNKSHSAAYALLAYQTAWLKAHYPAQFMAAVMSADKDNTDKLVHFIEECKLMGLTVIPPSINASSHHFTVCDDKTILYGLGAIKGVGEAVINSMVCDRDSHGKFLSLFDFCSRLDLRKLNRRVLDAFIKSGAMDEWGIDRAMLTASLDNAIQLAASRQRNRDSGQIDLLSLLNEDDEADHVMEYVASEPWHALQRLKNEKDTLGFFLTGHPVAHYWVEFKDNVTPIAKLNPYGSKKTLVCALVKAQKRIMTKTGKKLIVMTLEDHTGHFEVVVFDNVYETLKTPIQVDQVLVVEGEVSHDNFNGGTRMLANTIYQIHEARVRLRKSLTVTLTPDNQPHLGQLQSILKANQGACPVRIQYKNTEAKAVLAAGQAWRVNPTDELLQLLRDLLGKDKAHIS